MSEPVINGQYASFPQRALAMLAHASCLGSACLLGNGVLTFLLPTLVYLGWGRSSPLVDHHCRSALNVSLWASVVFGAAWGASRYYSSLGQTLWLSAWGGLGLVAIHHCFRAARARDVRSRLPLWVG